MVRDIEVKEKGNLPFLFSYRAIKELNKAGIKDGLESIEKAAFLGFKYGHIKRNQTITFKEEDIEEWFDDDISLIGKITEIIQEVMQDFEKETEGKKKALKKV